MLQAIESMQNATKQQISIYSLNVLDNVQLCCCSYGCLCCCFNSLIARRRLRFLRCVRDNDTLDATATGGNPGDCTDDVGTPRVLVELDVVFVAIGGFGLTVTASGNFGM